MKKIRLDVTCLLGMVAAVTLFVVALRLQIKNGYARDAGIYVSQPIFIASWILLGVCFFAFVGFWMLQSQPKKRWSSLVSVLMFVCLVIFGCGVSIGWKASFEQAKNADIQHENIHAITLEQLNEVLNSEKFQVVYIGRDNCPLCEYIMPDFTDYLEYTNLDVLYYNTKQDRETRREEMNAVLNSIPVHGVPFILAVEGQQIVAAFEGELVVDELKAYMADRVQ